MATAPDPTQANSAFPLLPRNPQVPINILDQGLISDTSNAHECFAYQRLAGNLQAYLIDYVNKISGDFSIYQ